MFVLSRDGSKAERRVIRPRAAQQPPGGSAAGLEAGERVIVSNYVTFGKNKRLQIDR